MIQWAVRLFDPLSFLLVAGGALMIAIVRHSRHDLLRAFGAFRPLFRDDPERDAEAARHAVRQIAHIADLKGTVCADRVRGAGAFVRRAAIQLANSDTPDDFREWADHDLSRRAARHAGAASFWRAIADAAPSAGMIGTVIGLIGMFAAMEDPARMGAPMALALLTTLYGLLFSAVIAGPIAARLERLSEAELAWQRAVIDKLESLARAEAPGVHAAHPAHRLLRVAG